MEAASSGAAFRRRPDRRWLCPMSDAPLSQGGVERRPEGFRSRARPVERSRARGARGSHLEGSSSCDRSREELNPNPIGSDTSCRGLAGNRGWRRRRIPSIESMPLHELADAPPLAPRDILGSRAVLPRERGSDSPHPRCLRFSDRSRSRPGLHPQAVPSLWMNGLRLCDLCSLRSLR